MDESTVNPKEMDRPRRKRQTGRRLALRGASVTGPAKQAKTKHLAVKVQPALFEAAARRVGSTSPTIVIEAALTVLATQDDLGPWLAEQWGTLADVDPELLRQSEF